MENLFVEYWNYIMSTFFFISGVLFWRDKYIALVLNNILIFFLVWFAPQMVAPSIFLKAVFFVTVFILGLSIANLVYVGERGVRKVTPCLYYATLALMIGVFLSPLTNSV